MHSLWAKTSKSIPRDFETTNIPLAKPPGVYRILFLGDSTTFGWGVSMNETTAKILERELNAVHVPGYERFEVINAGVGNYDTVQEVTYYKTSGRKFHPDMVVLGLFHQRPGAGSGAEKHPADRSVLSRRVSD